MTDRDVMLEAWEALDEAARRMPRHPTAMTLKPESERLVFTTVVYAGRLGVSPVSLRDQLQSHRRRGYSYKDALALVERESRAS